MRVLLAAILFVFPVLVAAQDSVGSVKDAPAPDHARNEGQDGNDRPGSRSLQIKFEEVIDHATAGHHARRKIVREDSDGRRLIIELEQIVVHACRELLRCLASQSSCRAFREPTAGAT